MRELLSSYSRLGVPGVYRELSTSRLLVLEFVEGVPIRDSTDSDARREAGRQLLEAFYKQILTEGFFHADPHPGNLLWTGDKIVLLDLGMTGELGPELRELMIVLLLAFARNDPKFLTEAILMLAGEERRSDIDLDALEGDFARFIDRFHVDSLREIQIGPMLDGMIRIAAKYGIRLPASLALSGKAFGQVQLAIAELDPTLDPFRVVGDFLARNVRDRLRRQADPQHLFYEGQKLKLQDDAARRGDRARDGRSAGAEAPGRLHRLTRHRGRDHARRAPARTRRARRGERLRCGHDGGGVDGGVGLDCVRSGRCRVRRLARRRSHSSLTSACCARRRRRSSTNAATAITSPSTKRSSRRVTRLPA